VIVRKRRVAQILTNWSFLLTVFLRSVCISECFACRLMFWTDWGAVARLERATLSGLSRRTLVDVDIIQPMGVTIDYNEERVYWVDRGKGAIESISLDGSKRQRLFEVDGTRFFGIALYQVTLLVEEIV